MLDDVAIVPSSLVHGASASNSRVVAPESRDDQRMHRDKDLHARLRHELDEGSDQAGAADGAGPSPLAAVAQQVDGQGSRHPGCSRMPTCVDHPRGQWEGKR
jgi:hypothetical protein